MLYNDNKRYYTLNNYLQAKFGCKVFKVSLNAGLLVLILMVRLVMVVVFIVRMVVRVMVVI